MVKKTSTSIVFVDTIFDCFYRTYLSVFPFAQSCVTTRSIFLPVKARCKPVAPMGKVTADSFWLQKTRCVRRALAHPGRLLRAAPRLVVIPVTLGNASILAKNSVDPLASRLCLGTEIQFFATR